MNTVRPANATLPAQALPSVAATVKFGVDVEGRARYDSYERDKTNIVLEPHEIQVRDARPVRDHLSLAVNGFELREHTSTVAGSTDPDELNRDYHAEMVEFVRAISGTPHVLPQRTGLLIRHATGSVVTTAAKPAGFAHLDYTALSAGQIAELVRTWEDPDAGLPPYRSFAIIQTWRATSPPPQDSLLAVCEGSSVHEADWIVADSVIGPEGEPGNVLELRLGKPSPTQSWYYFSNMTRQEVLVFNGFDSRDPDAMNVLHTSIRLPAENATPRASIEARFVAYFE